MARIDVAFYNVENLFDTIDDPNTFDGQFLPDSMYQWNTDKYESKLEHLASVISGLANGRTPAFVGLCEIENRFVLVDLMHTGRLDDTQLGIIHVESKDARGIDVAALYDQKQLKLLNYGIEEVDLSAYEEKTRDILWAKMKRRGFNDVFYFVVNHWPSRRGGLAESEPKRVEAAKSLKSVIDRIHRDDPDANVVIMGDFNDEPDNKSISDVLGASDTADKISNTQLFNAMSALQDKGEGSYCFRGNWNMLDQIIVNGNLLDGKKWEYNRGSAYIHAADSLRQGPGKYEGFPLRTFGGRKYLNGYSDHFAVSAELQYYEH